MQDVSEIPTKNKLKVITVDEFLKLDETEDLCFLIDDGKLSDDFEEYFETHNNITSMSELDIALNEAKHIPVYKKDRFKLNGNWVAECIEGYLEDNYCYDTYEHGSLTDFLGLDIFNNFAKTFNEKFTYYTSNEQVYILDLSKEFEQWLREDMEEDYPKGE